MQHEHRITDRGFQNYFIVGREAKGTAGDPRAETRFTVGTRHKALFGVPNQNVDSTTWPRHSLPLKKPDGSSPCSQKPVTCPHTDGSKPISAVSFHFNIIPLDPSFPQFFRSWHVVMCPLCDSKYGLSLQHRAWGPAKARDIPQTLCQYAPLLPITGMSLKPFQHSECVVNPKSRHVPVFRL